jgi:hypothetical protein
MARLGSRAVHVKRGIRHLWSTDGANAIRRHVEMRADQGWTLARRKLPSRRLIEEFDGDPRFAILTVNRSTTRYLKLMLLTLCEQIHLGLVERLVITDNHSRDGGASFLRSLAAAVERVELVENRTFLNHARGIRRGLRQLDSVESRLPARQRSNLLLLCDPDLVFRNRETLRDLATAVVVNDAAVAGELRRNVHPYPEAQASFLVVRRDWYSRRDVVPFVNHGSPAYWMQRSVWQAGGTVVDFRSNFGGFVLHRGRSAVAVTREYTPWASYATARSRIPHFMGVPDGQKIWDAIEVRHADLLKPANESALIDLLAERLAALGRASAKSAQR